MTVHLDKKKLDQISAGLKTNTDEVLKGAAYQVEAQAKMRTPVDTGNLRASEITTKIKDELYFVHDGTEYGIYQELGTSKMAAQPFMVPAVEQVRKTYADMWKRLFK